MEVPIIIIELMLVPHIICCIPLLRLYTPGDSDAIPSVHINKRHIKQNSYKNPINSTVFPWALFAPFFSSRNILHIIFSNNFKRLEDKTRTTLQVPWMLHDQDFGLGPYFGLATQLPHMQFYIMPIIKFLCYDNIIM